MITSVSDWFKVLAPLFQPIISETKTNPSRLALAHFPALCVGHKFRLRVITSTFDWFTGLSPSFLIGQSNYFGFGFTTLDLLTMIETCSISVATITIILISPLFFV